MRQTPSSFELETTIYNATKEEMNVPCETSVIVRFTILPGDKGCYYALPENCYPAEPPELEIEEILSATTLAPVATTQKDLEKLEDEIWDFLKSLEPDFDEPETYLEHHFS